MAGTGSVSDTDRPFALRQLIAPVLALFVQVTGSYWISHGTTASGALTPIDYALLVVGPLLLLARYRWPTVILAATTIISIVYLGIGNPYGPVVLSAVVALYAAVVSRRRIPAAIVGGSGLLAFVAIEWIVRGRPPTLDFLERTGAFVAIAIAVFAVAELMAARRIRLAEAAHARQELQRQEAGEERLRIVQELHDVLGHSVSLINVQAGAALHFLDRDTTQARVALQAIRTASGEALAEVRSMLELMRGDQQAPLRPTAGLDQLPHLIDQCATGGLEVSLEIEGHRRALPAAVDLAAFRIIQEALTNVMRHSGVTRARVRVDYASDELAIEISNDRSRTDQADGVFTAGSGIDGMRRRAEALGGEFAAGPRPRGGFSVTARLSSPHGKGNS